MQILLGDVSWRKLLFDFLASALNWLMRLCGFLTREEVVDRVMRRRDIAFVTDRGTVAAIAECWWPDYDEGRWYGTGHVDTLAGIVRQRYEI
jgi:hypothetical protein